MRNTLIILTLTLIHTSILAQPSYFPPITGDEWETLSPDSVDWLNNDIDQLTDFLEKSDTKAYILLVDGKIVMEEYFDNFTRDSIWIWRSAAKTITSVLTGIAQGQGLLSIEDKVSKHLGSGWTSLSSEKEDLIRIRHMLTMTAGLKNKYETKPYCTDPECLIYNKDAGDTWWYYNANHDLITKIIATASGQSYNQYMEEHMMSQTGMDGQWLKDPDNYLYFKGTPRSMARFGLLMLNKGIWASDTLMYDRAYVDASLETSQVHNPSYGYYWWLNGKDGIILPGGSNLFPSWLLPKAPEDLYAGVGQNAQTLIIIPSLNAVLIRLGDNPPPSSFESPLYQYDLWDYTLQNQAVNIPDPDSYLLYPNPCFGSVEINFTTKQHSYFEIEAVDIFGKKIATILNENIPAGDHSIKWDCHSVPDGLYFIRFESGKGTTDVKYLIVKQDP